MQLKDKKAYKKRFAYWRGERLWIFLKGGVFVISLIIFITLILLGIKESKRVFPVKNIVITGNNHLEEDEIKDAISAIEKKGLLRSSLRDAERRLRTLPWIKKAYLRKQFPDTLIIRIEETVPKAILNLNGIPSLMDGEGKVLEKIREEETPFLPIIKGINPEEGREALMEALSLIDALSQEGIIPDKGFIEITSKPYGLSMNMDGEVFKVGYGRYAEKLRQWKELEGELRKRGIAIEYVDLRFPDRVIVKPIKTLKSKQ